MPCGDCKTDCKCTGQKGGNTCGKGQDGKCTSSKVETKNTGSCCKGKGSCH